jgi:hypothetical protein
MKNILEFAVFRRPQNMLVTNFMTALDLKPELSVSLVAGGAVLAVDDQLHIDLDRSHTVLSPNEARQFAAELKRIADVIDPLSQSR